MFVVETIKEVSQVIPNLHYIEIASLLHAVSDAIRQGQSLGNSLEELGVVIASITDDGCYLLPQVRDVADEMELIAIASSCTAHLMQAYRCGC